MLRVAVIGAGIMGKMHLRAYSNIPNAELVAVADVDKGNLKFATDLYKIRGYSDYREMLEKERLDLASIVVPSELHKMVACDVINKKINVLVEKPIATTVEDAKEIIAAAKRAGVKLMPGHIERFNTVLDVIKKHVDASKIVSVSITRVGPFPPRMSNIGVIQDIGVHDIDLIRYITGSEFDSIFSCSSSNIRKNEDTALLTFKMKNGVLANISTNWLTPYKVRAIEIAMTDRFIRADLVTHQVFEYTGYHREKADSVYTVNQLFVPYGESIVKELQHFIDCIEQDREPLVTGEDGLEAIRIAQKCVDFASKLK